MSQAAYPEQQVDLDVAAMIAAGIAGVPVISVPGGISPRAAIGYLFVPVVVTLAGQGKRHYRGSC